MCDDLYANGDDSSHKDVCLVTLDGKLYAHKSFLVTYFNYCEELFTYVRNDDSDNINSDNINSDNINSIATKILDRNENNQFIFPIDKPKEVINILMKCLYQMNITRDISVLEKKWDILLDVLELYDFWNPKDNFSRFFQAKYEQEIIRNIDVDHPKNIYHALLKLEGKQLLCVANLRLKLIEKYQSEIIRGIGLQALQKHKLEDKKVYRISKLAPETLDIIYNFLFVKNTLSL